MTVFGVPLLAVLVPLVSRDLSAACCVGGRVAVLHVGRVVEAGPAGKVLGRSDRSVVEVLAVRPGDRP
ncbi:hypothetical protein [Streptomyces sp. NPDC088350]|uniref:hypothetical protein n=1 Tax=Streptomyces sp. NPDC088350 TaxID=3365854 RepID=UPI003823A429